MSIGIQYVIELTTINNQGFQKSSSWGQKYRYFGILAGRKNPRLVTKKGKIKHKSLKLTNKFEKRELFDTKAVIFTPQGHAGNPYGDGKASERIVAQIASLFGA
jgi:hypothetical protein